MWLQDGRLFGTDDDFGMLNVAVAPRWTLGVVDFSEKLLIVMTLVIILMRIKFWRLHQTKHKHLQLYYSYSTKKKKKRKEKEKKR